MHLETSRSPCRAEDVGGGGLCQVKRPACDGAGTQIPARPQCQHRPRTRWMKRGSKQGKQAPTPGAKGLSGTSPSVLTRRAQGPGRGRCWPQAAQRGGIRDGESVSFQRAAPGSGHRGCLPATHEAQLSRRGPWAPRTLSPACTYNSEARAGVVDTPIQSTHPDR